MLLYEDFTIILELHKNYNILCVRWLEAYPFRMSEFELSFQILMEKIEKHRIKKIVADCSKTMIHLPDEEYKSVITLLQSGLAHSKIEKIAQIFIDKSERDLQCITYFEELMNDMQLKIQFRNFDDRKSALLWLAES